MRKQFFSLDFFISALIFLTAGNALTQVIPEERMIDWSQVGVRGGIPDRNAIYISINPGATATDNEMYICLLAVNLLESKQ